MEKRIPVDDDCTVVSRLIIPRSESSWRCEYNVLFHDGAESNWLSEEEVLLNNFMELQVDMFYALWILPSARPRPAETLSRAKIDSVPRDEALRLIPRKTKVRKRFEDNQGNVLEFEGEVFDFRQPFYRIKYADGDWEEMNPSEMREHAVPSTNEEDTTGSSSSNA